MEGTFWNISSNKRNINQRKISTNINSSNETFSLMTSREITSFFNMTMIQNTQLMLYQHDNDPKYTAQINKLKCHHKARLEFNRKFVGSAWQATE